MKPSSDVHQGEAIEVKPIKVMSNLDEVHQGVVTQGEVTSA